jgi:hypothetical protein
VASTDHVYVVSLILNTAQVRHANSNAVALKLISRPPARFVEFKSGTLAIGQGLHGPAACEYTHLFTLHPALESDLAPILPLYVQTP